MANTLNENQENSLFHNTGTGNNWVKLRCVGTTSNTSAVGAKMRLKLSIDGNDVWQTRKISATSGTCSQNSYTNHFGLKDGTLIDELEITWPSGTVETFTDVDINQTYKAIEGTGVLLLSSTDVAQPITHVKLYPNPVVDSLTIEADLISGYANLDVQVYDVTGKKVLEVSNLKTVTNRFSYKMNCRTLDAGVYFYSISDSTKQIFNGKFIKI